MALLDELMGGQPGSYPAQNTGLMQTLMSANPPMRTGPRPPTRGERVREALTNFTGDLMFTLGEALKGSASAPGRRGTQMGLAAALQGPTMLRAMEQEQALKQQEADRQAAMDQAIIGKTSAEEELTKTRAWIESERARREAAMPLDEPNIDALSDKGIEQAVKREQALQGVRPPEKPNFQRVEIMGPNGQAVFANYNPATGTVHDPEGNKIVDPKPFRTPPDGEAAHVADRLAEAEEKKGEALSRVERIAARSRAVEEYAKLKRDPAALDARILAIESAKMVREDALRNDYEQRVRPDFDRKAAYDYITSVRDTAVGGPDDIVLIYNFVKMQDPNAVKEGEIDLVRSTGSLPDTWKRYLQNITTGAALGPDTKKKLLESADKLYKGALLPRIQQANKEFTDIATRRNLNPDNVVRPIGGTTSGPAVGTVEDGYIFQGGDPADPKNWKAQ